MIDNIVVNSIRYLKKLITYQPPQSAKPFVLEESPYDKQRQNSPGSSRKNRLTDDAQEIQKLLVQARELENTMEKAKTAIEKGKAASLKEIAEQLRELGKRQIELDPIALSYDTQIEVIQRIVSTSLDENEAILRTLYNLPENKDLIIRHFEIPSSSPVEAMIVFLDGMIDKNTINMSVLQPLMIFGHTIENGENLIATIVSAALPNNETKLLAGFREIADNINRGDSAVFFAGAKEAVVVSTKGYATRGIGRPMLEQTVRGSQSAFSESLRINTGLLRTMLPSNDLVTEIITVGDRIPAKCAIIYMKSIVNPALVREVKRRIRSIRTDYIVDIGILEQFIEDHPKMPFPQMLSTERPDRTAVNIVEGRVAILLDGIPFAHIAPVSFFSFFHTMEDFSLKIPAGSFMRLLRLVSSFFTITLPSIYLAINYFHPEALPTEMLLAIAGAREAVPFPALLEIVIMEASFELIREAGLRIPGMLGSTIGIVGAIILGQAAVAANIVSPVLVVVIAITGLASFALPDYRFSFGVRLTRFIFLLLAASLGLVGVSFGLLLLTVMLSSMKSIGVPYMTPIGPKTNAGLDAVIRGPVFQQEFRPDELNAQDERRQPRISRQWIKRHGERGNRQ
ncbi:MAG: spore germination protein [Veillonellales bacterium]